MPASTQRIPLGLVGPSSKGYSAAQQSARTVNLIPEGNDADAKAPLALRAAPGAFRFADATTIITSGHPRIRGMHVMGSRAFVVVDNKIAELTTDNTFLAWASLSTFTGRVVISDNNGLLIVGDGTGFYVLNLDTFSLTPVLNDGAEQIVGTYSLWVDGYTLYFERGSSKYFYSALNDPLTVNGLNFMSAEGDPDKTVAAVVLNREIFILGEKSLEGHQDSGGADNVFTRIPGAFSSHGCVARWTACRFDNSVCFVGRNAEGQGRVWRLSAAGQAPTPISTPAVEEHIERVLFHWQDQSEAITAFAYEMNGHPMYRLNLPAVPVVNNNPAQASMTWVYDGATGMWHEQAFMNPATGLFERSLSDFHVLWHGRHYTGGYADPYVYELRNDVFRENNVPIVKLRESSGPLEMGGRRFTVNRLEIEGEHGVGRDGGVQGSDPQIILQYAWDGKPWSNEVWRAWGKLGETNTRAIFGPCGSGKSLVVRVVYPEPTKFVLTGGWADVTVGA